MEEREILGKRYAIATRRNESGDPQVSAWKDVVSDDKSARIAAYLSLAEAAFERMPKTLALIRRSIRDAYVVSTDQGVMLVVERDTPSGPLLRRSFAPQISGEFGGSLKDFYSRLDGFCTLHDMGGILPLAEVLPLGEDGYEYETEPSATLAADCADRDFRLIFNSGGKGKAYVDRASTFADAPLAAILWLDDAEPRTDMDFWDLMDNWTVIAMDG